MILAKIRFEPNPKYAFIITAPLQYHLQHTPDLWRVLWNTLMLADPQPLNSKSPTIVSIKRQTMAFWLTVAPRNGSLFFACMYAMNSLSMNRTLTFLCVCSVVS